ncbi:hypothetical protein AB1L88_12905 [Tautonia sp. JC769]|uniref:hypothetical protein n=1 Tax=Tautonia sp. JC769 TaxID=3232135 RepID=UPI00345B0DBB
MNSAGDPCLYVNFYRDVSREFDPENWSDLVQRFGGEPAVVVMADVSGRHPGDEQVFDFVTDLLSRFSGSAQDDYTEHLWSLDELRAGFQVSGHPFFDYIGWHAQSQATGGRGKA